MLFPLGLGYLKNAPKLRLGLLFLEHRYALHSILCKPFVILVEVNVILSLLFKLLSAHGILRVIMLVLIESLLPDLLRCGLSLKWLIVAHLLLDVIPLRCHSTCHIYSSN